MLGSCQFPFYSLKVSRLIDDKQLHNLIYSLLLKPHDGYYQTLSRLSGAVAQYVPIIYAPLLMNIIGLTFQVLPLFFLLGGRFDTVIPRSFDRVVLAIFFAMLPNCAELHANATMAKWYLAILAFMILVGDRPKTCLWKLFDIGVIGLCSVSGPFAILLTPICLLICMRSKTRWSYVLFVILLFGVLVQGCSLILLAEQRPHGPLDPTWRNFIRILGGQLLMGTLFGGAGYNKIVSSGYYGTFMTRPLTGVLCALVVYIAKKGPWELKLFGLFFIAILSAALITPTASDSFLQVTLFFSGFFYGNHTLLQDIG